MFFEERVYSVLIVSHQEKFVTSLAPLLPEGKFYPVDSVSSASSAKQKLLEKEYDIVIINCPLQDEFGTKLAIDICSQKGIATLLFVKSELYAQTHSKAYKSGVFTIAKPTSPQSMLQALDWLCATRERLRKYEKNISSVQDKMQEIRTINRAKWLLIEVLNMTEEDAHHFIEKQAMDRCLPKIKVAQDIIATYS